ncbi:Dolichyl-phosphate-mannose-protein mannosyltransferase [uncultured archaeon]|nr:Dolichyl-phosphate-mannose-protein mannosyltransferase [uncultured archaeon]
MRRYYIPVVFVFIIGFFFRIYNISTKPDLYVDELIYVSLAENWLKYQTLKLHGFNENFFYHPFLGMLMIASWFKFFGVGFTQARVLSVLLATFTMGILYLIGARKSTTAGLLTLVIFATDPLIVYVNRLVLLENISNFFAILGIYLMVLMFNLKERKRYSGILLIGVSFGLAITTKLTYLFVILLLLGFVYPFRRLTIKELLVSVSFALLVLGIWVSYGLGLSLNPDQIIIQTLSQFLRTQGALKISTGFTVNTLFESIFEKLYVYSLTFIILTVGVIYTIWNSYQIFFKNRREIIYEIQLVWALSVIIIFGGVVRLLHEQYMYTIYSPFILGTGFLLDDAISYFVSKYKSMERFAKPAVHTILILIIVLNYNSWSDRYIYSEDDAMFSTLEYINNNIPKNAVIYTEQDIISRISHKSVDLWTEHDPDMLATQDISYMVASDYWIHFIQENPLLKKFVDDNFKLVRVFKGYTIKQTIYIYIRKT